ncbi:MAG: oligoendopeptidase F [Chloroflexota bacterium]
MVQTVPPRSEIRTQDTWNLESIFPDEAQWERAFADIETQLPATAKYVGHVGDSAAALADWLDFYQEFMTTAMRVMVYARLRYSAETTDSVAKALSDRASGMGAQVAAALSFAEPEILAIESDTLTRWIELEPRLREYKHYIDQLEALRPHIRSAEVEEVLGLVGDPFSAASATHRILTDTDIVFAPVRGTGGEEIAVSQGNQSALLSDPNREIRRSAWQSFATGHLEFRNTMANALAAGIKQDVFTARVRHYNSSLEAALAPQNLPVDVFHNLISVFRDNLPTWHRYWRVRRKALGYDELYPWDIKAPLAANPPFVPYAQAVEWITEGMKPLGEEYVQVMERGCTSDRWVDIYPNEGKTAGAFASGVYGTQPFILMSYTDDLYSLSTLAHELGHAMHGFYTRRTQKPIYGRYGMFAAETASNFNQAMVRGYLMQKDSDRDFQITLIEEAMSNFHRYFFIMPTLARFELIMHERAERGQGLTASTMIDTMADLFAEGYGSELQFDRDETGITWAQFSHHLYMNFYVFQYATGISAANALAEGVLAGGPDAAERYLTFLSAGGSKYPLDLLREAGVDMRQPQPVEAAFAVLGEMVDRLEKLVGGA